MRCDLSMYWIFDACFTMLFHRQNLIKRCSYESYIFVKRLFDIWNERPTQTYTEMWYKRNLFFLFLFLLTRRKLYLALLTYHFQCEKLRIFDEFVSFFFWDQNLWFSITNAIWDIDVHESMYWIFVKCNQYKFVKI